MHIIADLHLHSPYSRAVSKHMTLEVMAQTAREKGIQLLTAADWTHPAWFTTLTQNLLETAEGLYTLQPEKQNREHDRVPVQFLLSTEIACIYKQGEKVRRIHNLVFVPSLTVAQKVTRELIKRGANLSADGRPIISLSSRSLLELILEIDERSLLIPCHVWTPHFGIYGSASGFDSLEEAFGDLTSYIYGIETGLSSDPEMNWQIPELATRSILSFSDAHSPAKMGREATVFDLEEVTYENVRKTIMGKSWTVEGGRSKVDSEDRGSRLESSSIKLPSSTFNNPPSTLHNLSSNRILYTIEFYPEEGKYHYSGHRNCGVSYGTPEIAARGTTCPVCGKRLTEGVMLRVQTLAGKDYYSQTKTNMKEDVVWYESRGTMRPPYVRLVPLAEIIAGSLGVGVGSKKVQQLYTKLITEVAAELPILLEVPVSEITLAAGEGIARGIQNMRKGNLMIVPGYDGEYGKVILPESDC